MKPDGRTTSNIVTIRTRSSEETESLGQRLGAQLGAGDVVALKGGLGAGKTTVTRGIARGVEVSAEIHSPTFTLIHEHFGRLPFYHADLYRLSGDEDAAMMGLEEYLYGEGVTVIEWADRALGILPSERIEIELRMVDDEERELRLSATPGRLQKIIESVVVNACAGD